MFYHNGLYDATKMHDLNNVLYFRVDIFFYIDIYIIFLLAAHLPQNAVKLCVIVYVRVRPVCVLLEGRVQRFDVCSWTIVGDAVEERAFEAGFVRVLCIGR